MEGAAVEAPGLTLPSAPLTEMASDPSRAGSTLQGYRKRDPHDRRAARKPQDAPGALSAVSALSSCQYRPERDQDYDKRRHRANLVDHLDAHRCTCSARV